MSIPFVVLDEMPRADDDPLAVDDAGDAVRDDEFHFLVVEVLSLRRSRCGDDRKREGVEVVLLDRRGQADQVFRGVGVIEGDRVGDRQLAAVSVRSCRR